MKMNYLDKTSSVLAIEVIDDETVLDGKVQSLNAVAQEAGSQGLALLGGVVLGDVDIDG